MVVQTNNRRSKADTCSAPLGQLFSPTVFRALGDPTRVAILAWLAQSCGPRRVGEVAECCPVDLSVVSRHLGVLRDAGIVAATRVGREVQYEVRYAEIAALLRRAADAIEACCLPRAGRSKT